MNRLAQLTTFALVLIVSSGCFNMRTNTRPPTLSEGTVPQLNVQQPVALRNSSPNVGETIIGRWGGWKVHADLHKYTESAIGALRTALESQSIEVSDEASKTMELSVYNAHSQQNMWNFTAKASLRVRTGDGYEQIYEGATSHGNGYGTTSAMEKSIGKCIGLMFEDDQVRAYLENWNRRMTKGRAGTRTRSTNVTRFPRQDRSPVAKEVALADSSRRQA